MTHKTRALIEKHWQLANARRWTEFETLLHPSMMYECPQTLEYAEGAIGYLEVFRTWPGNWRATIKQLVCEGGKAVCIIAFEVGKEHMTGISIFEHTDGRLTKVTDYWPEPYDPPPRATPLLKRRAF